MKREVKRFIVPDNLSDQRIDQVLPLLDTTLSRAFVRKILDIGGVHLNGRRHHKCSQRLNCGDKIELFIDGLPLQDFDIGDQHIVYQDDDILILNKPAGIDCQPTPSRFHGTIYSALLKYLADPYRRHQKPSIGMLQRLDRDTSGLMVFSIHPRSHKRMTEQFSARTIEKHYIAIVDGRMNPDEGEIRSMLARNRATNRMKSVEKGGQEAVTRYRAITLTESASIVDVELLTGRSHQIRAHFSEAGHPLLGDVRYSGPSKLGDSVIARQMLHANKLSFHHPVKGGRISFELAPPEDMHDITQLII